MKALSIIQEKYAPEKGDHKKKDQLEDGEEGAEEEEAVQEEEEEEQADAEEDEVNQSLHSFIYMN